MALWSHAGVGQHGRAQILCKREGLGLGGVYPRPHIDFLQFQDQRSSLLQSQPRLQPAWLPCVPRGLGTPAALWVVREPGSCGSARRCVEPCVPIPLGQLCLPGVLRARAGKDRQPQAWRATFVKGMPVPRKVL